MVASGGAMRTEPGLALVMCRCRLSWNALTGSCIGPCPANLLSEPCAAPLSAMASCRHQHSAHSVAIGPWLRTLTASACLSFD